MTKNIKRKRNALKAETELHIQHNMIQLNQDNDLQHSNIHLLRYSVT